MKKFYDLERSRKTDIINQASIAVGVTPEAIEKDWWVTLSLKAIFTLQYAEYIVFKGGTSLSKGWNLIDRFSEDIDLSVAREKFGYKDVLKKSQITELRKASCSFFSNEFQKNLDSEIRKMRIAEFDLKVRPFKDSDTDPVQLELHFQSILGESTYLPPLVLIEIGSRSMIEPSENRPIMSILGQTFNDLPFSDAPVSLPVVLPKRTFLEKAFLLHEEFHRPPEKMKPERKSRHLYDLEKLMDTKHGTAALQDTALYNSIVEHRKTFTRIGGIDYNELMPDKIDFIPPDAYMQEWENDYKSMQESMIYRPSLPFGELINRLTELRERFRKISLE